MTKTRRGIGRLVSRSLAVAALVFVGWIIPVRDRCWDPRAPMSTRAAVSRDDTGCVLHVRTGDVRIGRSECAQLTCEPGVVSTFARARPGVLLALMALYAMGTLAWAARWRALLGFAGVDLPVSEVWCVSIEAQAGGVLLPGGIGGDALRVAAVLGRPARLDEVRSPAVIVVASVLLDRAVGLALVATVAAILGVASGGISAGPLAAVLGAVPIALVIGLLVLRAAPLHRTRWLCEGRVGRVVSPLLAYVRDSRAPGAIVRAAALSVVVAATQFAVIRGLLWTLGGAPTQEKWVYVGTAMAFIVAAVPALPGAWGTADAAYVFFFGLAGIGSPVALAVSLVYRVFWYLSGVVGAILHMARPRAAAEPDQQA